ncbi:MAG: PilN domain-containing protein [Heliobacteriaceae bacterium]|nr:PilN domain-containing protein [Heliobacteriaceae bacterium]MDD4587184.1 PilN domain-containing protein [Heliobacteriaceae bacterium]
MQSINLLPEELQPPRRDKKQQLVRVGVVLIVGLGLITYGVFLGKLYHWRLEGEKIKAELAALAPVLSEIASMEAETAANQTQLDNLRSIKNSRLPWSKVFVEVNQLIPPRVWLTTVTMEQRENRKSALIIYGETVAFENIGVFILRLERLPYFSTVSLVEAKDHEVNKQLVTRFQINCALADLPAVLQNPPAAQKEQAAAKTSSR